MSKICVPDVIRRSDHPWDPDVLNASPDPIGFVEYSVIDSALDNGEPVFYHSGQRVVMDITNSTSLGAIKTAIEADATSRGWLA